MICGIAVLIHTLYTLFCLNVPGAACSCGIIDGKPCQGACMMLAAAPEHGDLQRMNETCVEHMCPLLWCIDGAPIADQILQGL